VNATAVRANNDDIKKGKEKEWNERPPLCGLLQLSNFSTVVAAMEPARSGFMLPRF